MDSVVIAALAGDEGIYKFVFLLHIASAIVGFGSTFVYPILGSVASERRGIQAVALSDGSLKASHIVTNPFIYATAVFGLILVIITDPWEFGQTWVWSAIILYVVAVGFSHGVHQPNLKKMNALTHELAEMGPPPEGAPAGPPPQALEMEKRGKNAALYGAILDVFLVLILILMIWKPGYP
jgi:uncharacterized membrane protein